jgi:excinuclease UvrABC nuclease subunit
MHTTQALIHHFKTVQAVKEASLEELQKVVNNRMAETVYTHFHSKD